jgi:hypothetical protein
MLGINLVPRLLPLEEERPCRSWSRDLLKSSMFLIDDDDKYLVFIL